MFFLPTDPISRRACAHKLSRADVRAKLGAFLWLFSLRGWSLLYGVAGDTVAALEVAAIFLSPSKTKRKSNGEKPGFLSDDYGPVGRFLVPSFLKHLKTEDRMQHATMTT